VLEPTAQATVPDALDDRPRGLDPRLRTAWTLTAVAVAVAAGAAAAVIAAVSGAPVWLVAGLAALGLAAAAAAAVGARLAWAHYSYRAGSEALEIRHGVVVRTVSAVPYRRIQQIDVRRGPIERRLGLATLVLRSAAATTDAAIPGLADEDAEALRAALLARAGIGDAV
jgi:membrane protein YdbS with pleckstrin-like domain